MLLLVTITRLIWNNLLIKKIVIRTNCCIKRILYWFYSHSHMNIVSRWEFLVTVYAPMRLLTEAHHFTTLYPIPLVMVPPNIILHMHMILNSLGI